MLTKKIILATILVVTIVLAGSASLASLSVNVKALGNDTFTAHPPTSNGSSSSSSSSNTLMAKIFQHAMNDIKKGK
jgi:hypothetical protein